MANSYSSSLVVDTATSAAVTVLQNRLAALNAFNTDFSSDIVAGAGLRKLQVAVVGNAATAVSSPTTFETNSGDTVTAAAVTMTHYSAQFYLTSAQLNQGFRLEKVMKANLRALANAVMDATTVNITTTNYTNTAISGSISTATGGTLGNSFISTSLPKLFAACKDGSERNLVLDGSLYGYLLPVLQNSIDLGKSGAYGFDRILLNNRWAAGSATGLKGFVASPESMACASAIPYIDPAVASLLQQSETIDIPDLGLSVQFNLWGSLSSRSLQASFDVLYGSSKADGSALTICTNS